MSHKKCLINKVYLNSIHWIPLSFFHMVHTSCLCTKFQTLVSKASHLNSSLNTHFFVMNISSANPYFLVRHFYCCLTGNVFWHIKWPDVWQLSDSFLCIHFLVWIIYFFNPFFFLHQFNHCLTGNAFYHIQHIITDAIYQWLIPQQHNKITPPMVSQRLHPAAPLLPPCCQPRPSLAAHCLPLAAQSWCWPLPPDTWSVIWLWSVRRPLSKQNEIRWAFFASIGWIQFLPCEGNNSWKWPMATVTVMDNEDYNCNGN